MSARECLRYAAMVAAGVVLTGATSAWGQKHIRLGPSEGLALFQPMVTIELFEDADGNNSFGPAMFNQILLDTGANSVIVTQTPLSELLDAGALYEKRKDGSDVELMEMGVAGSEPLKILKAYRFDFAGTSGERNTILNARIEGNPLADFSMFGPFGLVGMPAMVKRVTTIDLNMNRWIGDDLSPPVAFLATAPTPPAGTYHVKLAKIAIFKPEDQMQPGDPPPVWAPLSAVAGTVTQKRDKVWTDSYVLDTGAQMSVISTKVALRMGIDLSQTSVDVIDWVEIGGIGGSVSVPEVMLDHLVIPTKEGVNLVYDDVPVLVRDIAPGFEGVIGMDLLTNGWLTVFLGEANNGALDLMTLDLTDRRWELGLTVNKDFRTVNEGAFLEDAPRVLTWQGSIEGTWSIVPENWKWAAKDATVRYNDFDQVIFDDSVTQRVIDIPFEIEPGSILVNASAGDYTFKGEAITGDTGLTKKGTSTLTLLNKNTYLGPTDVVEGKIVFGAPQDIGPVNVLAAGRIEMQTSQRFAELNIVGGKGSFTSGGDKLLVINKLSITDAGRLDLADNAMVIHVTAGDPKETLSEVEGFIWSARGSAGDWLGAGLTSSSARDYRGGLTGLGAILNDKGGTEGPVYTEFGGEPVGLNSILVKYTWNGDANLDGVVNADDYFLIDSGYITQKRGWYNGDFNYDGMVNADDYFLIDSGFIGQTGVLSGRRMVAAVPEPGALTVLAAGALGLMTRRRIIGRCGGM